MFGYSVWDFAVVNVITWVPDVTAAPWIKLQDSLEMTIWGHSLLWHRRRNFRCSVWCAKQVFYIAVMAAPLTKTHLNICNFFVIFCQEMLAPAGPPIRTSSHVPGLWGRWETSIDLIFCSQKGSSLSGINHLALHITADACLAITLYLCSKRSAWPWK